MAKMIDITEKLDIGSKPQIKIGDVILTVNDEAETVLKIIPLTEDESPESMMNICTILFSDEDIRKISEMRLSLRDYITLIKTAIKLVTGNIEGETQTPATT